MNNFSTNKQPQIIAALPGSTNMAKPTTLSGFVQGNNVSTGYFLVPSGTVPTGSVVSANSGSQKVGPILTTNQVANKGGKIMFLTTSHGQLKAGTVTQPIQAIVQSTMSDARATTTFLKTTSSQQQPTVTAIQTSSMTSSSSNGASVDHQRLNQSSGGQTFHILTPFPQTTNSSNIIQPIRVLSGARQSKHSTATQIVTVIDNQNGNLQIRPAGPIRARDASIYYDASVEAKEAQNKAIEVAQKTLIADEVLDSSDSGDEDSSHLIPGLSNFVDSPDRKLSYFERKEIEELERQRAKRDTKDTPVTKEAPAKKLTCSFGFNEFGIVAQKPEERIAVKRPSSTDDEEKTKTLDKAKKSTSQEANSWTPKWQKDLTEDEINKINSFGRLPSSILLAKLKELHNMAFHLAYEQEKEMLKARFLNILGTHHEPNINGHSLTLRDKDFACSESKLFKGNIKNVN